VPYAAANVVNARTVAVDLESVLEAAWDEADIEAVVCCIVGRATGAWTRLLILFPFL
jgi:hypothetical protein